ncbi:MAG: PIG-L family deacetylase [Ferruginibacter sp.]
MRFFVSFIFIAFVNSLSAQSPKPVSSSDILQQIKKLQVHASVLYVAAHPDDENTRLLSYLANEKLYRTGYLSLTRGDGGQNLIGDEQGIDLGLIRTQELLAARRVDGAEQFFTRAYDFGFSKNPEEALRIWDHDKILGDVVWVIRSFRPDVIISRFPTTGEGGHGHHTASAILASEAFDAAADPTKYPEQFKHGVSTWQAKRLLWNTFNFGNNNLTREDQFKTDVGVYNPVIGKSYGEMAAESRSKHRSQGFGVPAQRGSSFEYFATIKGTKPVYDLMDGVEVTTERLSFTDPSQKKKYKDLVEKTITGFDPAQPVNSLPALRAMYTLLKQSDEPYNYNKQMEVNNLVATTAGLFMEAIAVKQLNTIGDSAKFNLVFNNRTGIKIDKARAILFGKAYEFKDIKSNENNIKQVSILIPANEKVRQPYWLQEEMSKGMFIVSDQKLIGKPQDDPYYALYQLTIDSARYDYYIPVQFKSTDPVKGETFQPVQMVYPVSINSSPSVIVFSGNKKNEQKNIQYTVQSNLALEEKVFFQNITGNKSTTIFDSTIKWTNGEKRYFDVRLNGDEYKSNINLLAGGEVKTTSVSDRQAYTLNKISYEHIPDIFYNYKDKVKIVKTDLHTAGTTAGYIAGAGDKIPEALLQMGYKVTMLQEGDINLTNLKQFDVIITGVRAYNIHSWLSNSHFTLMKYVEEGGVLLSQYNTNNSIGPVRAKISPYPFTISRNRVTDETAVVNFLLPEHPALNYPNKITQNDFDGWIQERSIYHAENIDSNYQKILSMKDPGEKEHDGSLIIANYGKGRFVYTGLVFFRELPAGVGGAYRLFANLIANKRGN